MKTYTNQEVTMRFSHKLATATALLAMSAISAFAQFGQYSSRSLLEKKIFVLNEAGKIDTCRYWRIYLGNYKVEIAKEFPGEGSVKLKAEVNYSFLSSMYIEGKGYSSRGKIDAEAEFAVPVPDSATGDSVSVLDPTTIDYVIFNDAGKKVKTSSGAMTDLKMKISSDYYGIRQLMLSKFYFDKDYGELKPLGDVNIIAFSFSKEGIVRASQALKGK
jgi:hypothetical protein